ncbi:hypothetical protein DFH08DRAFT_806108 [Mycena albidolilacea]|uniref:Uncharacterized protein n=1 Tax=Mycena albidolilacea TaxID=1033008 RepID=A0AAD7A8H2_9AGAR|nr:hypothetical protein DFH08DRAFT_806108 [Mycena albidolilacea]
MLSDLSGDLVRSSQIGAHSAIAFPLSDVPQVFSESRKDFEYTAVAANALRDAAVATQTPFLNSVCAQSSTIVITLQSEEIRYPKLLEEVAQYAGILQNFMRVCTQRRLSGFSKQSEITTQLDSCEKERRPHCMFSREAIANADLEMNYGVGMASALFELDVDTEQWHQEFLELIPSQNAAEFTELKNCHGSDSFPLLSASPKIFYGKESELVDLVDTLASEPTQIAILGPGGMGKLP